MHGYVVQFFTLKSHHFASFGRSRCAFSENRALATVVEVSLRSKFSGFMELGDDAANGNFLTRHTDITSTMF